MAEDRRENTFGIGARKRVFVSVADAGRLDFDQHLAGARAVDVHGFQAEGLARLAGHGGANLHRTSLWRHDVAMERTSMDFAYAVTILLVPSGPNCSR